MPDFFAGWKEFEEYVNLLIETGSIDNAKRIYWDIRPHPFYPTLEFRACDLPDAPPRDARDRRADPLHRDAAPQPLPVEPLVPALPARAHQREHVPGVPPRDQRRVHRLPDAESRPDPGLDPRARRLARRRDQAAQLRERDRARSSASSSRGPRPTASARRSRRRAASKRSWISSRRRRRRAWSRSDPDLRDVRVEARLLRDHGDPARAHEVLGEAHRGRRRRSARRPGSSRSCR